MSYLSLDPRTQHNTRQRQSKNPSSPLSTPPWLKYLLLTEFDNKTGSVIKHQIPRRIPGYTTASIHAHGPTLQGHLAELLIPPNAEGFVDVDFHLVILYKDTDSRYRLTPPSEASNRVTITEEGSSGDSDSILFLYTITKTVQDSKYDRGTMIRSLTFAISKKWFGLLSDCMDIFMDRMFDNMNLETLMQFYKKMNEFDLERCGGSSTLNQIKLTPDDIPLKLVKENQFIISDTLVVQGVLQFLSHFAKSLTKLASISNLTIVIYSHSHATSYITQFVMALSRLFNGFMEDKLYGGYVEYYPLIDISNWETVLGPSNRHSFKFIGTKNIVFKDFSTDYDLFYDLDEHHFQIGEKTNLPQAQLAENQDKVDELVTYISGIPVNSTWDEVINLLRRFSIHKIATTLLRLRDSTESQELDLKQTYQTLMIVPLIFQDLFTFKALCFIENAYNYRLNLDELESNIKNNNGTFPDDFFVFSTKMEENLTLILSNLNNTRDCHHFSQILKIFPTYLKVSNLQYPKNKVEIELQTDTSNDPFNSFFKPLFLDLPKTSTGTNFQRQLLLLCQKLIHAGVEINDLFKHTVRMNLEGPDAARIKGISVLKQNGMRVSYSSENGAIFGNNGFPDSNWSF